MRYWINCPECAELIPYDIEGVSPSEMMPISDMMEERFGPIDRNLINDAMKEVLAGKGYKEVHLFNNCPKCGARVRLTNWMPLT